MLMLLTYDHSLDGFFTAVFEVYEYKFENPWIRKEGLPEPALFGGLHRVITDAKKAERVINKLKMLLGENGLRMIVYGLLTEEEHCEKPILDVIRYAIAHPQKKVLADMTNLSVLKLERYNKQVNREKHRMEAFVRFRLIADSVFVAEIEPDFNVMPIIAKHFRQRYQDQKWMIFDRKRHYGLYYDLQSVELISINHQQSLDKLSNLASDEAFYSDLWRIYFDKTSIASRKNSRLHVQHVPKRYWKYLTEKNFF